METLTLSPPESEASQSQKILPYEDSDQQLAELYAEKAIERHESTLSEQERLEGAVTDHAENLVYATEIITLADRLLLIDAGDKYTHGTFQHLKGLGFEGQRGNFSISRTTEPRGSSEATHYAIDLVTDPGPSSKVEKITFGVNNGAIEFESVREKELSKIRPEKGRTTWNSETLGSGRGYKGITPEYFEGQTNKELSLILKLMQENSTVELSKLERKEAKTAKKAKRLGGRAVSSLISR